MNENKVSMAEMQHRSESGREKEKTRIEKQIFTMKKRIEDSTCN